MYLAPNRAPKRRRVLFLLSQKGKYRGNTFALECRHTSASALHRWLAGPSFNAAPLDRHNGGRSPTISMFPCTETCIQNNTATPAPTHPRLIWTSVCTCFTLFCLHLSFHFLNTRLKMTVRLIDTLNLYPAFHGRAIFFSFFFLLTAVIYNCRKDIITFGRVGHRTQTNTLKIIFFFTYCTYCWGHTGLWKNIVFFCVTTDTQRHRYWWF